jgi:hypothetical protein
MLTNANEHRDWRIYADFAQILIGKARTLYANEDFGIQQPSICELWDFPEHTPQDEFAAKWLVRCYKSKDIGGNVGNHNTHLYF